MRLAFLTVLLGVTLATAAVAQDDAAVAAARAAGQVGEQADGYLGFASSPSAALRAAVDAVNIKRRAVYTDLAAKRNATVQEVAAARGCEQLRGRVANGEKYELNGWKTKTGPINLPPYCG
jgi:uncharacterized protein YdbL (DUF1318 family)